MDRKVKIGEVGTAVEQLLCAHNWVIAWKLNNTEFSLNRPTAHSVYNPRYPFLFSTIFNEFNYFQPFSTIFNRFHCFALVLLSTNAERFRISYVQDFYSKKINVLDTGCLSNSVFFIYWFPLHRQTYVLLPGQEQAVTAVQSLTDQPLKCLHIQPVYIDLQNCLYMSTNE